MCVTKTLQWFIVVLPPASPPVGKPLRLARRPGAACCHFMREEGAKKSKKPSDTTRTDSHRFACEELLQDAWMQARYSFWLKFEPFVDLSCARTLGCPLSRRFVAWRILWAARV